MGVSRGSFMSKLLRSAKFGLKPGVDGPALVGKGLVEAVEFEASLRE